MIDDFRVPKRLRKPVASTDSENQNDPPAEEDFKTPDEVAAVDTAHESEQPVDPDKEEQATSDPELQEEFTAAPRPHWYSVGWPWGRQQWLVAALSLVLIMGAGAAALVFNRHPAPPPPPPAVKIKKAAVKPTTVPSTLSGLPVDPSVNERPVTAVMVENSDFARPQSGLKDASVIFEAIAEGGITRFMALYQDTQPTNVGPIRSVRPYYEQWALGFDASVAHVGGSPEALSDIKKWHVKDLDQFYNANYYHRINAREAPHNVYTGIPTLAKLEEAKGFTSTDFTGFPRKKEAPLKQPTATSIDFSISWSDYSVHYAYDKATNSYKRWEGGAPHIDAETKVQLHPKVIIAMVVPYSLEADGYHSDYSVIGSGTAYIFQDGGVTLANWHKPSMSAQVTFTSAGKEVELDPGQTWLSAVSSASKVSYK